MTRLIQLLVFCGLFAVPLYAQPGTIDPTFNPTGDGANDAVFSTSLQPDEKVLIAGSFTAYNGTATNHVARLNSDGQLDPSFNTGSGTNGEVWSTLVQPDGKILIAGDFTSYDGINRHRIARLNTDGSLDSSFDPGNGANNDVWTMALQPDGKVLVGGDFTVFNGLIQNRITRLNPDGSLDASFDTGSGSDGTVLSFALDSSGRILIGGNFSNVNGMAWNNIGRLGSTGNLDLSFDPGSGPSSTVFTIRMLPDEKIMIGGVFGSYNGTTRKHIARLEADGALDSSFDPGAGPNATVISMAVQMDGNLLIGGVFTNYAGIARGRVARVNPDGSLDSSFDPGTGAASSVRTIALRLDGKVIVAGLFTSFDGTGCGRIARVHGDLTGGIQQVMAVNGIMTLAPNPAHRNVTVYLFLATDTNVTLTLMDTAGRIVKDIALGHRSTGDHAYHLSIDELDAGNYVMALRTTEGRLATRKLLLQ